MKRLASFAFLLVCVCLGMRASDSSSPAPATPSSASSEQTLVLAGGCFWCLDAAYELVPGVTAVECGYAGGHVPAPSYRQVCTGSTGHAEVVRIHFDPAKVSLQTLFDLFWKIHDPTSLNRQGADEGTQYRSAIFFQGEAQKAAAAQAIQAEQKHLGKTVVTQLEPLSDFWRAEEYHQQYFRKNPNEGYCQAVVRTKVEKAKAFLAH